MTRKDYRAIAEVLRAERPDCSSGQTSADAVPAYLDRTAWERGAYDEWATNVLAFARMLRDQAGYDVNGNRAFDADKFYAACGFAS